MRSSHLLRAAARNTSGATAIEFAFVAPVFLCMLAGILVYGLYFGVANSVQQLAADAARASVAGITDAERSSIAKKHVTDAASSFVFINPSYTTVTAQPSVKDANIFEVTVSYDASRLPIWSFDGLLPTPSKTIVRSSAIQRGGY